MWHVYGVYGLFVALKVVGRKLSFFMAHESRPRYMITNARSPHTLRFQGSCSVAVRFQPSG